MKINIDTPGSIMLAGVNDGMSPGVSVTDTESQDQGNFLAAQSELVIIPGSVLLANVNDGMSPGVSVTDTESQDQGNPPAAQPVPVTSNEFIKFKTETQKSLDVLHKAIEENSSIFGIDTGILSISSLALTLVLAVVIFLLIPSKKIARLNEENDRLRQRCSALEENAESQSGKLKNLEEKIDLMRLSKASESYAEPSRSLENYNYGDSALLKKNSALQVLTLEDKCRDFVKDFNNFASRSGYDARKAADEFLRKYNIQAFSCANHEARMNEPIPPPEFSSVSSVHNGDFWAYEVEAGVFAVVPRVKAYTDNYHRARAAGMIFNSNFEPGNTYKNIRVNKVAIFRGMWNLAGAGELELG